jgi:hypothetical protein
MPETPTTNTTNTTSDHYLSLLRKNYDLLVEITQLKQKIQQLEANLSYRKD